MSSLFPPRPLAPLFFIFPSAGRGRIERRLSVAARQCPWQRPASADFGEEEDPGGPGRPGNALQAAPRQLSRLQSRGAQPTPAGSGSSRASGYPRKARRPHFRWPGPCRSLVSGQGKSLRAPPRPAPIPAGEADRDLGALSRRGGRGFHLPCNPRPGRALPALCRRDVADNWTFYREPSAAQRRPMAQRLARWLTLGLTASRLMGLTRLTRLAGLTGRHSPIRRHVSKPSLHIVACRGKMNGLAAPPPAPPPAAPDHASAAPPQPSSRALLK